MRPLKFEHDLKIKFNKVMAVTRLKRKTLKNRMRAGDKNKIIQQMNFQPVIKNIDVEAIKKSFREEKAE